MNGALATFLAWYSISVSVLITTGMLRRNFLIHFLIVKRLPFSFFAVFIYTWYFLCGFRSRIFWMTTIKQGDRKRDLHTYAFKPNSFYLSISSQPKSPRPLRQSSSMVILPSVSHWFISDRLKLLLYEQNIYLYKHPQTADNCMTIFSKARRSNWE